MGGGASFESSSMESGMIGVVVSVDGRIVMMGRPAQRWAKGSRSSQQRHISESAEGLDHNVVEVLGGANWRS